MKICFHRDFDPLMDFNPFLDFEPKKKNIFRTLRLKARALICVCKQKRQILPHAYHCHVLGQDGHSYPSIDQKRFILIYILCPSLPHFHQCVFLFKERYPDIHPITKPVFVTVQYCVLLTRVWLIAVLRERE